MRVRLFSSAVLLSVAACSKDPGPGPGPGVTPELELAISGSSPYCGTVTVTATVLSGEVTSVEFRVDGDLISVDTEAPFTAEWDTTGVFNASHSVSARPSGAPASQAASLAVSVTNYNAGCQTRPTVSFTAPSPEEVVGVSFPVRLSTLDDVGVTRVELFVDDVLVETLEGPFDTTLTFLPEQAGAHTLAAVAYDGDGLSARAEVSVSVDAAPPTVSFVTPTPDEVRTSSFEVLVQAADDVRVSHVELWEGGVKLDTLYHAPYRTTWSFPYHACGAHTLKAVAVDASGKRTETSLRFFQATDACDRDCDGSLDTGGACGGTDCDDTRPEVGPFTWEVETIATSTADFTYGAHSAIAVGGDGGTHVAFSEDTRGTLLYWSSAGMETIEPPLEAATGPVFTRPSLKLDAEGHAHVCYLKLNPTTNARTPWYATNATGAWVTEEVKASTDSSEGCSLGVDSAGKAHLVHLRLSTLWYATNASGAWVETRASENLAHVMPRHSLVVDSSDRVHVVYTDNRKLAGIYGLKGAAGWTYETIHWTYAEDDALAVTSDGTPLFASREASHSIKLATRGSTSWNVETVWSGQTSVSLGVDATHRPHLAFWADRDLKYARRKVSGTGFVVETVDTSGDELPTAAHLALDPDGNPRIVYRSLASSPEVRVARALTCGF